LLAVEGGLSADVSLADWTVPVLLQPLGDAGEVVEVLAGQLQVYQRVQAKRTRLLLPLLEILVFPPGFIEAYLHLRNSLSGQGVEIWVSYGK
jgi:hypothetical protein